MIKSQNKLLGPGQLGTAEAARLRGFHAREHNDPQNDRTCTESSGACLLTSHTGRPTKIPISRFGTGRPATDDEEADLLSRR